MTQTPPTRAIFINYRRDDTGGEAGRLYDDLTRAFDANTVFMDVAGIAPGKDFRKSIDENVAQSAVLLAIIGRQWLSIPDATGARRLDNPNDFVRLEIASALAGNIPVIPVLVQNAAMPSALALPEPLQDLAYRNAVELTLPRWNSDVALLVAALKNYVHAATTVPLTQNTGPIPVPPPSPPPRPRAKPSLNQIFGPVAAAIIIAVLILVALTVALYEYGKKLPPTSSPTQSQPVQATPSQTIQTPTNQPAPAQSTPLSRTPVTAQPAASPATQLKVPAATSVANQVMPSPVDRRPGDQRPENLPPQKPLPDTRRWGEQQYRVEIPYNATGIYADGDTFSANLGLDGRGRAYPSFRKLMTPGTRDMSLGGATFRIIPFSHQDNVFRCQTAITLDLSSGVYTTMRVLAVSTHGPQLSVPFSVTYEGSKKQDFVQSISDWTAVDAQRFPGEHLAVEQTYANTAAGVPQNGRFAVYEYDFVLNDLFVRTLTLPHNENVVILAITFVP